MLSDQSPSNPDKAYWMRFLNQNTAIAFGPELISLEYKFVPVYAHINTIKPGYYAVKLISFNQNSAPPQYGDISAWHAGILQQGIIQNPQYWLWSHRRWKHKAPESIAEWHTQQIEHFEKRFGRPK
jgi:KDO2-lipid IV(A) lauroyltransferase